MMAKLVSWGKFLTYKFADTAFLRVNSIAIQKWGKLVKAAFKVALYTIFNHIDGLGIVVNLAGEAKQFLSMDSWLFLGELCILIFLFNL